MENTTGQNTRKNQEHQTMYVDAGVYEEVIQRGLRREYGHMRSCHRFVARLIGVSPRTVQNWLEGACAPRGAEMIRLMQVNDKIADDIFQLVRNKKHVIPD